MKSYIWKEGEKVKQQSFAISGDEDSDDSGHKEEGGLSSAARNLLRASLQGLLSSPSPHGRSVDCISGVCVKAGVQNGVLQLIGLCQKIVAV